MALGLGLGFARRQGGVMSQGLMDLTAFAAGDSTEEHHFTQYSGAGEVAFEAAAALDYEGSVDVIDAARSGSFLLKSTALSANAGNVNLFWVDDGGVLADGPQLSNNVINNASSADITALSLGINDHAETVSATASVTDYSDAYAYMADRTFAVHGCMTMINSLSRDSGGDDDGANIVMAGILDAVASNAHAVRGVDVYDLDLTDSKHHTQAAQEEKARREAQQIAFYTGNSTEQALGPRIVSAVLKTDIVEIELQHIGGTDIVAPSSGAGGFDAEADGVLLGAEALTRIDASHAALLLPEGTAPAGGASVSLFAPYGANGGGLASGGADVMVDNSAMVLPVQRDIVSVTQSDPVQALDNLNLYFDARGSAKVMNGTEVEAVSALGGALASASEVDAGDHATWDPARLNGTGGLVYRSTTQLLYSGFTAGSTHTIGMVVEHPTSVGNGEVFFFGNSAGATDNQAKLSMAGDGRFYYVMNEGSSSVAVSDAASSGQASIIFLEFVNNDVLNVYHDGEETPSYTLNPRNDFSNWDSLLLGARTAGSENSAYSDLAVGAYFHTLDVLSATEKSEIASYWSDRFSL